MVGIGSNGGRGLFTLGVCSGLAWEELSEESSPYRYRIEVIWDGAIYAAASSIGSSTVKWYDESVTHRGCPGRSGLASACREEHPEEGSARGPPARRPSCTIYAAASVAGAEPGDPPVCAGVRAYPARPVGSVSFCSSPLLTRRASSACSVPP
jgi:hypothetical protein